MRCRGPRLWGMGHLFLSGRFLGLPQTHTSCPGDVPCPVPWSFSQAILVPLLCLPAFPHPPPTLLPPHKSVPAPGPLHSPHFLL